jgi:predicted dienelactone hydrolase
VILVDSDRLEVHTADPGDRRSVPIQLWYPAVDGTGSNAEYVDNLAQISDGLAVSGALAPIEVAGLSLVRTDARDGAAMAAGRHPVVLLSPGNQTNVAFYASLAEDLASHGYLVVGIDHPFHVAATIIDSGLVATYDHDMDSGDPATSIAAKVDERVADVLFVLESLRSGDDSLGRFLEGADLERVGILGHSNGGLTAFEACRVDEALDACLNMDGLAAGGLLGHRQGASGPPAPFLILTKETSLAPTIGEHLEESAAPAVRAVIPDAAHDNFTDGPLFQPSVNPATTSAQRIMTSIRSMTAAFFDHWLKKQKDRPFDGLDSPAGLYINVYPLGGLQPLPNE